MSEKGSLAAKRGEYLRKVYEKTCGDEYKRVDMFQVGEQIDCDKQQAQSIAMYLHDEGLVDLPEIGCVAITHAGVTEVERSLPPDEFQQLDEKRFAYLRKLYDLSGGNVLQSADMFEVGEQVRTHKDLIPRIVQYLKAEGLIVSRTTRSISITPGGIRQAEEGTS